MAGELGARLRYIASHWGEMGKGEIVESGAPNPAHGVLTELGELVEIVYATKKAGDLRVTEYEHRFSRRRPILAYNEGGLVIVRNGSLYRVSPRGIVG